MTLNRKSSTFFLLSLWEVSNLNSQRKQHLQTFQLISCESCRTPYNESIKWLEHQYNENKVVEQKNKKIKIKLKMKTTE